MLQPVGDPEQWNGGCVAKGITSSPTIDFSLSTLHSHIKKRLHDHIIKQWQDYWDYSNKDRYTHGLDLVISQELFLLTRSTTPFLTGYGTYFFKFHKALSLLCECSRITQASHHFDHCPLTTCCHIRRPLDLPTGWVDNILSCPTLLSYSKIFSSSYVISKTIEPSSEPLSRSWSFLIVLCRYGYCFTSAMSSCIREI